MLIKDITIDDIIKGLNWRVVNPEKKVTLLTDYYIESYTENLNTEMVVYSGLLVFLSDFGEPRSGFWDKLFGKRKSAQQCIYPPDNPDDLKDGMIPIVKPMIMLKTLSASCWDYLECIDGEWKQLGLKPNKNAPLTNEYIANPIKEDSDFDIIYNDGPIRKHHMKCFNKWIKYIKV